MLQKASDMHDHILDLTAVRSTMQVAAAAAMTQCTCTTNTDMCCSMLSFFLAGPQGQHAHHKSTRATPPHSILHPSMQPVAPFSERYIVALHHT